MPRIPKMTPWMAAVQAGFIAREHWLRLDPADRSSLRELIAKSKGRPGNLSTAERAEVKRIVGHLDAKGAAWKLAPVGRRMRPGRR